MRRPTPEQLAAACDRQIQDVLGPDLPVLFVGINPGLWSGATGFHFACPGNRFWRTIFEAGLTPELLTPDRQKELLGYGLGITNLVSRTTATAAELANHELGTGAGLLIKKLEQSTPGKVAFLGVSTYRIAFARPKASVGLQPERIARCETWVLPNSAGSRISSALMTYRRNMSLIRIACAVALLVIAAACAGQPAPTWTFDPTVGQPTGAPASGGPSASGSPAASASPSASGTP